MKQSLNIIRIKKAGELRSKLKPNCLNIVVGGNETVNRAAVSNKNVDILLSPELNAKKDFMKNRNSGLNQVLAKLANKNKVAVGFNFQDVSKADDIERANIIGRMMLNIKLCRKYKVQIFIINLVKDWHDLRRGKDLEAFALTLGVEAGKVKVLQK